MYINKYHYIFNIKNNYLKNQFIQNEKINCNKFSEYIKKSLKNEMNTFTFITNEMNNFSINQKNKNCIKNIIDTCQKSHISLRNLEKIEDTLISTYHEIMNIQI
ncbi:flagellar hook-basal body complex protein FliE [Buchnera aphidicola]|uniref:flagellar hook-basal body complex protein FliE n=1 Tax=Buchnera aphidicola TaxID=9 RepID=UPI0020937582|nr:flagellar hook-basal body complex protein FliE [Buchnera aphidicola]USS94183.1 flagellar hook-basal body complex protein FliE [Buchnera aphidicola (Sipha maydis)]WII23731.1 flagellar hook-basal body complex protein FliE [Buchnera aphidicola (Sipha maydis)]